MSQPSVESDVAQSVEGEPLQATVTPSDKTFGDIQKTVNSAQANDVIELNGTYTGFGKVIAVKKSLTFNGVGEATLDAKKLSGIFHITNKVTVIFNNIKFINAKYGVIFADSDGYVEDVNVNLNINGCSFENNRNDFEGGVRLKHSLLDCARLQIQISHPTTPRNRTVKAIRIHTVEQ